MSHQKIFWKSISRFDLNEITSFLTLNVMPCPFLISVDLKQSFP